MMKNNLGISAMVLFCLFLPSRGRSAPLGHEPDAHRTATCAKCHQQGAQVVAAGDSRGDPRCLSCHQISALATGKGAAVHSPDNGDCLSCHQFHDTQQINTPTGSLAVGSPELDSGYCKGCHNTEGNLILVSQAHRTAAALYHQEGPQLKSISPSESCLRCHAQGSGSSWQAATGGHPLAFNPHASHPYGIRVTPGHGDSANHIRWQIDRRIPLFDGRMECQSCHLLSAGTPNDLIKYENPYDLCLGCHQHEPGPGTPDPSAFLATIIRR